MSVSVSVSVSASWNASLRGSSFWTSKEVYAERLGITKTYLGRVGGLFTLALGRRGSDGSEVRDDLLRILRLSGARLAATAHTGLATLRQHAFHRKRSTILGPAFPQQTNHLPLI